MNNDRDFIRIVQSVKYCIYGVLGLMACVLAFLFLPSNDSKPIDAPAPKTKPSVVVTKSEDPIWQAPDSTKVLLEKESKLISYGKELVSHTALYLGPNGSVMSTSNGMNCQNCHLKSGTKPFGNNYAGVAPTYPKFRARSGSIESVEKRVNDCIERSLNGKKLDNNSYEMKAFVAYIKWVGKDVRKGVVPRGTGLLDLPPIERAADKEKGMRVYQTNCELCHGKNAEGQKFENGIEWRYPPLAGKHSYNIGAGLYRLSRFAGFVKANMPHGITYENPMLTDEEAWDVAAFVNSLARPSKDLSKDWPDISTKPFDHPFGPYADGFSEEQHKYGPFGPIKEVLKSLNVKR
jgi:thiosulfate dehydrogenase